jgi:hypothetical protein
MITMKKPVSIFLSAVSSEFHSPDPDGLHHFTSYRAFLTESLRAIRQPHEVISCDEVLLRLDPLTKRGHIAVVSQENLAQSPGDLLAALEEEVRAATDGPFAWFSKSALRKINETFDESGRATSARSLYVALCELASDNQSDSFVVPIRVIATRAGLAPRWAGQLLTSFEALELVSIQRKSGKGELKLPSTYTLLPMRNEIGTIGTPCATNGSENGTMRTGRVQSLSAQNRRIREESSEESIEELSLSPASTDSRSHFGEFWTAYPKKRGKGAAKKAFAKVDVEITVLLTAIDQFRRDPDWLEKGGRFIPYPAKWLNERRWEDDHRVPVITAEPPRQTVPYGPDAHKSIADMLVEKRAREAAEAEALATPH